ncbi:response regulator [Desulfonema ishimotonii]|uniref:Response regulator n=1 Tax=Desulfonema ishimotonii TaxID=45657 RepID=A0A401FZ97_9BACT|nr:response regulator [Desulfonema ishimotonii]GBC62291.1 response regulator [Desulfonema ishimotonii]
MADQTRQSPTAGERIRLLLVDDEEGYLNVLSNRLGKRGMDVVRARSGAEAIQILRRQEFDVSVLDLRMEDMDGIEVLRIFKKMAPTLMVIMLTGHGSEKAARDGIALGAFGYLSKPCDISELVARIQEACRSRKITGSPPAGTSGV